ncbi:MAG: hypothetical protein PVG11_04580 [Anaerolineae bacterium]|jgi:uncharacterized OsmC-like protein
MALTMAAVADNKDIHLTHMSVSLEAQTEFAGRQTATRFVSHLHLDEGLTSREVRILYNAARSCEVHKILGGDIEFEEHLVLEGEKA